VAPPARPYGGVGGGNDTTPTKRAMP
jgi:hypothetical protein